MHISTHAPGEHGQTDERKQRGPEHIPVLPRAPGQGCAAALCRGNAAAPWCGSFHGGWEIKRAVTRARRGSKLPQKQTQNKREAIFSLLFPQNRGTAPLPAHELDPPGAFARHRFRVDSEAPRSRAQLRLQHSPASGWGRAAGSWCLSS